MKKYIAIDLGAESGRIVVGDLNAVEVIYRFPNAPIRIKDSIYWDILMIFREIKIGLKKAFAHYPGQIRSIGIDSWGVDFVLLDKNGDMLGNPYHYRDSRTDHIPEELFKIIPKETVFKETGIQIMQINTIYQLFAYFKNKPELYEAARYFLTIPDLINYWLSGKIINEYTIASTTQLLNPATKSWSTQLLQKLNFKSDIFSAITMPGTILGPLLPYIAEEIGAGADVQVIVPACHDTACAVTAVPVDSSGGYAYLSSGTWSLLGIESPVPIINDKSFAYNFTNEGSAVGEIRFLKNIMGLWIIQECKRYWDNNGQNYLYQELNNLASDTGPAQFKIDPDDPIFLKPGLVDDNMPARIKKYCGNTGQKEPENSGEIVRGIIESLALKYHESIKEIEETASCRINELYIIGGGSQNSLLCELTALKTGLTVYAGPIEATALGNIMIQMLASGEIKSLAEGRRCIKNNFAVKKY